jgi:hypothetical protein
LIRWQPGLPLADLSGSQVEVHARHHGCTWQAAPCEGADRSRRDVRARSSISRRHWCRRARSGRQGAGARRSIFQSLAARRPRQRARMAGRKGRRGRRRERPSGGSVRSCTGEGRSASSDSSRLG